jgi:hypothetical protein
MLKEEITELDAVTISAGTFEASDKKRGVGGIEPRLILLLQPVLTVILPAH